MRESDFEFLAAIDFVLSNGHYKLANRRSVSFREKLPQNFQRDLSSGIKVSYRARHKDEPSNFISQKDEGRTVQ